MRKYVFFSMGAAVILFLACNGQRPKPEKKPKGHEDPLRHKMFYNPNNGYEAYWADGEWHIRNPGDWDRSNQTTTRVPTVCGDECPYLYTGVGPICTRIIGNNSYRSCYNLPADYCGYKEDFLWIQNNYITYKSYCAYLDAKCKATIDEKPLFVHVGACIDDFLELYKPLSLGKYPVSRMVHYLDELNKVTRLKYLPSNYTNMTTRERIVG